MLPNGDDGMQCSTLSDSVGKIRGNVLNGIKYFSHKIDYLTLNYTFLYVLHRYFEHKNLFSFIRFIAIKNYNFLENWGKFKLEWIQTRFLEN